jgi:hypothetical protein
MWPTVSRHCRLEPGIPFKSTELAAPRCGHAKEPGPSPMGIHRTAASRPSCVTEVRDRRRAANSVYDWDFPATMSCWSATAARDSDASDHCYSPRAATYRWATTLSHDLGKLVGQFDSVQRSLLLGLCRAGAWGLLSLYIAHPRRARQAINRSYSFRNADSSRGSTRTVVRSIACTTCRFFDHLAPLDANCTRPSRHHWSSK